MSTRVDEIQPTSRYCYLPPPPLPVPHYRVPRNQKVGIPEVLLLQHLVDQCSHLVDREGIRDCLGEDLLVPLSGSWRSKIDGRDTWATDPVTRWRSASQFWVQNRYHVKCSPLIPAGRPNRQSRIPPPAQSRHRNLVRHLVW